MRTRLETLRTEGLVLEGQYPEIRDVSVSQGGRSHSMEVRPLVAKRADITVLRPTRTSMSAGIEYKL